MKNETYTLLISMLDSLKTPVNFSKKAQILLRFHSVVCLSKTLYTLLSTGSTQEDRKSSRHN